MIEATCSDYSEFVDIDINTQLQPINQSVDDLLTRLEEFETMVLLIQQERCNAIGLTGSLTDCIHIQPKLQELCQRIDSLEAIVEYLKQYVYSLENKVETMEEKLGFADTSMFKTFLKSSIFKTQEVKPTTIADNEPMSEISIDQFFNAEDVSE